LSKETEKLLREAARTAPEDTARELIHNIAQSMASYIAAIDSDSNRVSVYIERRLAPLINMTAIDIRVRNALERIARDGREG
jgi:hypothetical protein